MKGIILFCGLVAIYAILQRHIGLFIITSNSMYPTISAGDTVVTYRKTTYQVGDIVAFRTPSTHYITHRVISHSNGLYMTKGDCNRQPDAFLVHDSDIDGSVAFIIHTSIFFTDSPTR